MESQELVELLIDIHDLKKKLDPNYYSEPPVHTIKNTLTRVLNKAFPPIRQNKLYTTSEEARANLKEIEDLVNSKMNNKNCSLKIKPCLDKEITTEEIWLKICEIWNSYVLLHNKGILKGDFSLKNFLKFLSDELFLCV